MSGEECGTVSYCTVQSLVKESWGRRKSSENTKIIDNERLKISFQIVD